MGGSQRTTVAQGKVKDGCDWLGVKFFGTGGGSWSGFGEGLVFVMVNGTANTRCQEKEGGQM